MHSLSVFDVQTLMYANEVTELHPQIVSGDFVHLYATFLDIIGAETDEDCITTFLPPETLLEVP